MLIVNNKLKRLIRDFIPRQYQVPIKYHYNQVKSTLEPEMKCLKYLVTNNDQVIDVGGNRGVYAYRLWKLGAKIEVFEPNPTCFDVLKAWAANKPDVNINPVGLSNKEGSANLYIPVDNNGVEHDASASIENAGFERFRNQLVSIKTLDSYQFEDVSFIKIDVEGHEYSVIEGAAVLLASSRPALLVEIEQRHNSKSVYDVFKKILDFGYQGFFIGKNELVNIEKFDVSLHQSLERFGNSKGGYINNFLFLHRTRLANDEYDDFFDGCS